MDEHALRTWDAAAAQEHKRAWLEAQEVGKVVTVYGPGVQLIECMVTFQRLEGFSHQFGKALAPCSGNLYDTLLLDEQNWWPAKQDARAYYDNELANAHAAKVLEAVDQANQAICAYNRAALKAGEPAARMVAMVLEQERGDTNAQ